MDRNRRAFVSAPNRHARRQVTAGALARDRDPLGIASDGASRALKAGHTNDAACRLVNVPNEVFRWWCRKGGHPNFRKSKDWMPSDKANPIFRTFVIRVLRAQGQGEVEALATIKNAFQTDWRAAAWYLARRYPQRWGLQRERHIKILERRATGVVVLVPYDEWEDQQTEATTA